MESVAPKNNLAVLITWLVLILAVAGTFGLTRKLNHSGNAASIFSSMRDTAEIRVNESGMEPTSVEVRVGDEVLFVIEGEGMHSIAEERSSRRGPRLVSGELAAGDSYSLTFSEPGEYSFYDRMNTDAIATVRVVD